MLKLKAKSRPEQIVNEPLHGGIGVYEVEGHGFGSIVPKVAGTYAFMVTRLRLLRKAG